MPTSRSYIQHGTFSIRVSSGSTSAVNCILRSLQGTRCKTNSPELSAMSICAPAIRYHSRIEDRCGVNKIYPSTALTAPAPSAHFPSRSVHEHGNNNYFLIHLLSQLCYAFTFPFAIIKHAKKADYLQFKTFYGSTKFHQPKARCSLCWRG